MATAAENTDIGDQGRKPSSQWDLTWENYTSQNFQHWPAYGKHILAHFDDDSIVVYQAFKPSIAKFAVENQRLGGPDFSFSRMSWVKTNFLWMMYRCGWASKKNQERVLAVRLTRQGFENILSNAYTGEAQKRLSVQAKDLEVRLQWDPDHDPNGHKQQRRAIQLGLQGKTLQDYSNKYTLNIKDVTDEVHAQAEILQQKGVRVISTPRERVYKPRNNAACDLIQLDVLPQQTVVSFGPS